MREMKLLPSSRKQAIFLDNVRVSGEHLIGGVNRAGRSWALTWNLSTEAEAVRLPETRIPTADRVPEGDQARRRYPGRRRGGAAGGNGCRSGCPRPGAVAPADLLDVPEPHGDPVRGQRRQRAWSGVSLRERPEDTGAVRSLRVPGNQEPGAPHGGAQEVNQRSRAGQKPRCREHQHSQGDPRAEDRDKPDPGAGGAYSIHRHRPQQLVGNY